MYFCFFFKIHFCGIFQKIKTFFSEISIKVKKSGRKWRKVVENVNHFYIFVEMALSKIKAKTK